MAKPFESKIQNLVYNVDVGVGLRVVKSGLYLLAVLGVMLLYTASQFHGLREAEAMDHAQLARNLSQRGRLVTQCIRPASMWYLIENSPRHNPMINQHPDIVHAPLWPATLAAAFKASRISFPTERVPRIYPPEQWIVIPLCHVFTLLTGLLVYLLGTKMFDGRTGLLAVTMYFLSDTVWSESISGLATPLATFLATASFYLAFIAAVNHEEDKPRRAWILPLAGSLVLCVLAFLTRYAAVVLAPALALFIGFTLRRRRGWAWALGFLILFLVGISPWLARNVAVSGGPLGLAPYTALNDSRLFEGNNFERTLAPTLSAGRVMSELQAKLLKSFARYYGSQLRVVGDGLFICLFLTAFFYRFARNPVHLLRWAMGLGILLLLAVGALYGDATIRLLRMFWPLIIIYGLAFFFILLDRLQLRIRLFNLAVTTLFILLGVLPLLVTMMPPRSGIPYPPYFHPFIMNVSGMMSPDELLCTDMPWATAWYGNRNSLLLPATLDEFYEINDYNKRISGLYFTTITRDKPYARGLLTGADRTWFPVLEGRIPPDFPLTQGRPYNNLDQLFLTDRIRWGR